MQRVPASIHQHPEHDFPEGILTDSGYNQGTIAIKK